MGTRELAGVAHAAGVACRRLWGAMLGGVSVLLDEVGACGSELGGVGDGGGELELLPRADVHGCPCVGFGFIGRGRLSWLLVLAIFRCFRTFLLVFQILQILSF